MPTPDAAVRLAAEMIAATSQETLVDILIEACANMGCSWFALSHHIDFLAAPGTGIRVHNYPEDWARWFDERGLGTSDPVHRA
ncbi:MAG TPA: autoinducer binding domain-containing protein, partial [Sphingopyxis sp.]|nr:autoinducer binding domain-containing protein [Sphingopyxis sp.]